MLPDNGVQGYLNGQNAFTCDESFSIAGIGTYTTSGTPSVRRGPIRNSLGTEIATCEFTILCGAGGLQGAALAGDMDNAEVTVNRIFGGFSVPRFIGFVADVIPTSHAVTVVAKSLIGELARKLPIRNFSWTCSYVYGSPECGGGGTPCEHTPATCSTGNFGGFLSVSSQS
jgi:hypothetical protein